MHRGYVKLWRKSWDHPFYEKRPKTKREAWEDIVAFANHKETKVLIGSRVIVCGRGESVKSLQTWADEFGWSKSATRRFFALCQKLGQIRLKNETHTTRITVCNYEQYNQDPTQDPTQQPNLERNDSDTLPDTRQEEKNVKKVKKKIYGQFNHVRITKEEHARLTHDFGDDITSKAIKILDEYLETSGKRYLNHNLVLRRWPVDQAKQENGGDSGPRQYVAPYHREFEDE